MPYPKVAIAVPLFPNLVQTYILSQLVAFKIMGVDFSIVARKKQIYDALPSSIQEHKLLDDVIYINTELTSLLKDFFSIPLSNLQYRKSIKNIFSIRDWSEYDLQYRLKAVARSRAIAFRPFEIMHSHSMFSSFNYLFIKEALSIPLITTYHGQVPEGVNKLPDQKIKRIFEKGDAFLVNTNFSRNELIQMGCPHKKIYKLPQGTDLNNFQFINRKIDVKKKIVLLTVGRLSIEKGHHVAIEALAILAEQFPTLEYHLVGHGPEKVNLTIRCNKLGLAKKVKFHGFRTGNELLRIFSEAHIFILPSIENKESYSAETQGVVLQEAQASGIPVIGSKIGGIPEVITNNKTGLLFKESDHHSLANNIRRLILDSRLYGELASAGRRDVEERFDITVLSRKLIEIYNQILKTSKTGK